MANSGEKVIDTRLGKQTVQMDKVIHFPKGLIGFEDKKDFTLLQIRPDTPFLVLQSMDDPTLGLLVADPYSFLPDFQIKVGDAEQTLLQIDSREQVAVLVTVNIPPGKPEETSISLSGPILVNHVSRIGLQVPQVDEKRSGKVFLNATGGKEEQE
ncbi:flagellar assembly protein FliW [Desulfovibrio sp. OttesenSCG-928-I05]|nr:flagellar assembly protein FliW [Desulfovibrio sp. OttesenSCG-928-I05]